MECGLEKCVRHSLKNGMSHRKQHIGNTIGNEIRELELMKAYDYLDVEQNHNKECKDEEACVKAETDFEHRPKYKR